MKIKKYTLGIVLICLILILVISFVDLPLSKANFCEINNEDSSKESHELTSIHQSSTIFGDLSETSSGQIKQYEYYRDVILDYFNLTINDFYSLDANTTKLFNNYVFALWGYENGTLTQEEAENLTNTNSPWLKFDFTFPSNNFFIKRYDDEEFRIEFSCNAGALLFERVRSIRVYLDRNADFFTFDILNAQRLKLTETYDLFNLGEVSPADDTVWQGDIWGASTVTLQAHETTGYLDLDGVKIVFIIDWIKWDLFNGWVLGDQYELRVNRWLLRKPLIVPYPPWILLPGWYPIAITDDDIDTPMLEKPFLVETWDQLGYDDPDYFWIIAGLIQYGYYDRVTYPIEKNTEYGYESYHNLILKINEYETSPYGNIHVTVNGEFLGSFVPIDILQVTEIPNVPDWPLLWDREIFQGYVIELEDFEPGVRYDFSIIVEDGDHDRAGDSLFSDPYEFTLYSEAPLPKPKISGTGHIISILDDISHDLDHTYYDFYTGLSYDLVPYKENTNPAEMKFDLNLHNKNDYPIRINLNYTQFENNPRLSVNLNASEFNIIKHDTNGRTNTYEGFGAEVQEVIENEFFSHQIDPNIFTGESGSSNLWIELLPFETKAIRNFITVKVIDFEMIPLEISSVIKDNMSLLLEYSDELLLAGFDYLMSEIPYVGSVYSYVDQPNYGYCFADSKINLFDSFFGYDYLESILARFHFGIKIDNVYYPSVYNEYENTVLWDQDSQITTQSDLKEFLSFHETDVPIKFQYKQETGFYTFKAIFAPTDEQILAFKSFAEEFMHREYMLMLGGFDFSDVFDPGTNLLIKLGMLSGACSINSVIYHQLEIANGVDPPDDNYAQKANPELMPIPYDLFPELLGDSKLANLASSLFEESYQIERELQGLYISMNRYNTAVRDNQWNYANDQLLYAAEFASNANRLTEKLTRDLSFVLDYVTTELSNSGLDPFSNENLNKLKTDFEFDPRYIEILERQANFRSDDANDNSFFDTTEYYLNNQDIEHIRVIGKDVMNSIQYSLSSTFVYTNIEKNCIYEAIEIQTEKLSMPVIDDPQTQENLLLISQNIELAVNSFNDGKYQECMEMVGIYIEFALGNFTLTRNSEFMLLHWEGSRLFAKAQKYNQLRVEFFDSEIKEVINGNSIEYLFQAYNDNEEGMNLMIETIAPEIEVIGLPEDFNIKLTYLNTTELPINGEGNYYIVINKEETLLVKLIIEIPMNSPYELESYDFQIKIYQDFFEKSIGFTKNLALTILEDDSSPPEPSLSYIGNYYDSNPGILNFSIIEEDFGSDATGKLVIKGPNNYINTEQFDEGRNFIKDLYDLNLSPGDYTATLFVENNDEDRGEIDEEMDSTSISFTIIDDDIDPPDISIIHSGDGTDGSPGSITLSITEDNIGSEATGYATIIGPYSFSETVNLYNEGSYTLELNTIGVCEIGYYTVTLYAENNDDDGWEGDEEVTYMSVEFEIEDDDKGPPVITYEYTGDYTDGNPGTITFTATDSSGITGDTSITYVVPSDPETYTFTFTAWDADNDRPVDSLSATLTIPITIDDDDKDPPEITYVYTGDFTDGNPGTITFTATDPSGISGDYSITYDVLSDLGTQFFTFTADDADNDRLGDSLSSTLTVPIMIDDDDTEPPSILNLIIQDEIYSIQILFDVFDDNSGDDEGVSLIIILIDGEIALTYESTDAEMSFDFIIPNEWAMNIGHHNVLIEVWDADNDRIGDSSFSVGSGTFLIIFEEMKQYIIWEIDQFIVAIQESPDELWGDPTEQRKNAMTNKLLELKELFLSDVFEESYDKLLHDIKPLLTGLKTDENNIDWGNGIFKNAWVIYEDFEIRCNEILSHLQILIAEN